MDIVKFNDIQMSISKLMTIRDIPKPIRKMCCAPNLLKD